MTSPRPADPLLNAARIITYIALGVVALAMVALVLVSGAMSTFGRDELIAEMAKVGAPFALVWELGLAMINAALIGYEKPILEVRDIVALSQKTV